MSSSPSPASMVSQEQTTNSYQAAARFGLPALWQLPRTKGVMSNEASLRGTVAIGNEYLGAGQLSPEGARCYAEGMRSCLRFWGVLNGRPADSSPR